MINNKGQLDLLAHRIKSHDPSDADATNGYSGKYFKLGADITYTGGSSTESNYIAIGGYFDGSYRNFAGHFDGNNKTISGIRIYKTNDDQGLFGRIYDSGAKVENVILADATITGADNTGGIVGYNYEGTVKNCRVLSDVTVHNVQSPVWNHAGIVGHNYKGTITGCTSAAALTSAAGVTVCGQVGGIAGDNQDGTISQCLYLGTTLEGTTWVGAIAGVNSGTVENCYYTDTNIQGKNTDGAALDNANSTVGSGTVTNCGLAHKVTLGTGVTLGNAATEHGPLTVYGSVVAMGYNDGTSTTIYSMEGSVITLGYTVPDGYTFSGLTATAGTIGGNAIDGYTLTMPAADVTVTATFTKTPITTSYVDEDGTLHENVSAIPLDNTMTNLPGGWYVVNSNVALTTKLNFTGDTHLILADGKTLSIDASGDSDPNYFYLGLSCRDGSTSYELTIYGQTAGTGKVTSKHGHPGYGSACGYNAKTITINGGVVEATSSGRGICGSNVIINGGQIILAPSYANITADNITLGWRKPSDYIQAYEFINPSGVGTITITDGKVFTDGTGIYDNTTTTGTLGNLTNKTLHPCLVLADNASNADAIAEYDGKTIAVALNGRTLTKDGNWNTLCLPFDIADPAAVFGTGVKVKTLSGYTNNGTTVTVTFTDAATIEAGTPYIIMLPDNAVDMENPVFTGVTIDNTMHDVTAGDATFKGTYSPVALTANDKKKLFLADNMLWYPNAAVTVRACRAYFELDADVPENSNGAPSIVVDFGDGNSTGVALLLSHEGDENGASTRGGLEGASWYTLDGRKLSLKPSAKGLYIINPNRSLG